MRSLQDKNIKFVSARSHHITPLESIEIYTVSDNVRLHQVLENMKQNDAPIKELLANKKAGNDEYRKYFGTVIPDFDVDRVYVSDIKKILKWYEILKANDLLNFEAYNQTEEEAVTEEALLAEAEVEEKPKPKKAAAKKDASDDTEGEQKPTKKAAKKSVKADDTAGSEAKPPKKAAAKKATKSDDGAEAKPAKKAAKKKED